MSQTLTHVSTDNTKLSFRRAKRWNFAEKRRRHSIAVNRDLHDVCKKLHSQLTIFRPRLR
ncbi:hypothetical protein Scep_027485 [Stephania cephalantha]|uniref:Uncharacterized protein n=1 Tax=Stephania cephalantha TaxID=152367 RepID=A0AAP0EFJ7_9MAGN